VFFIRGKPFIVKHLITTYSWPGTKSGSYICRCKDEPLLVHIVCWNHFLSLDFWLTADGIYYELAHLLSYIRVGYVTSVFATFLIQIVYVNTHVCINGNEWRKTAWIDLLTSAPGIMEWKECFVDGIQEIISYHFRFWNNRMLL